MSGRKFDKLEPRSNLGYLAALPQVYGLDHGIRTSGCKSQLVLHL
jgi:hypothetical protein